MNFYKRILDPIFHYLPNQIFEYAGFPVIKIISQVLKRPRPNPINYDQTIYPQPFGMSSGWADNYNKMKIVLQLGAGTVVSKTITLNPKAGNPYPRFFRIQNGMINSMGLPNKGLKGWLNELEKTKEIDKRLIFSIKGDTIDEWRILISELSKFTKTFELNFSCPNVQAGVIDIKETKRILVQITQEIDDERIFLKLSPQYPNEQLVNLVSSLKKKKLIHGITAFNTIPVQSNRLGNPSKQGGLSGKFLFPKLIDFLVQIRSVYKKHQDLPIFATGGISSAQHIQQIYQKFDALPFLLTEFFRSGPLIFSQLGNELQLMIN